jgi:hypothetical protein
MQGQPLAAVPSSQQRAVRPHTDFPQHPLCGAAPVNAVIGITPRHIVKTRGPRAACLPLAGRHVCEVHITTRGPLRSRLYGPFRGTTFVWRLRCCSPRRPLVIILAWWEGRGAASALGPLAGYAFWGEGGSAGPCRPFRTARRPIPRLLPALGYNFRSAASTSAAFRSIAWNSARNAASPAGSVGARNAADRRAGPRAGARARRTMWPAAAMVVSLS